MPTKKLEVQLEDSWVVEGEETDDDSDYGPRNAAFQAESRGEGARRKTSRSVRMSPEPDLVMPSVYIDSMDDSLEADSSSKARARATQQNISGTRRRVERSGNIKASGDTRTKKSNSLPRAVSHNSNATNPQDVLTIALRHVSSIFSWLLDVFGGALKVLKTPLSYLLAIWLLFGLLVVARNLVTNSIYASLSPICRIPGVSFMNLPFCPVYRSDSSNGPPPAVEFDQLMKVQSKFEEVLEESAGGVSLPLDMKRGEASIRDLRQLVRYSHLHSKNELVLEFDGFIETARIASYDLQRFNSHVGRAVDSVIATTRWTTRVLDGIQERDASRGALNVFINDKLLAPFQPVKFTESILLDQYIQHTRIVEEEIQRLIEEAQSILIVLTNLEDRLDIIHGIATRDDMHAKALKEEVLSELWSMIGGNRGKINKMDKQLNLLKQIGVYRKTAFAHVSGTIIRLQAISSGLEDLRERVGSPELLRDRLDIPLSVHIENIQKGVERLEESRQSARKLEDEHIKRTLERGRLEGTLIDG